MLTKRITACLCFGAVSLAAGVCVASSPGERERPPEGAPKTSYGLFLGPEYRYRELNVLARIGLDFVAIPAGVTSWDAKDWGLFGAVAVPTVALMWPGDPSLDVRIQRFVVGHQRPSVDAFFPRLKNTETSIGTLAYVGAFWGLGVVTGDSTILELASLTSEALTVTQGFHVAAKLSLGREGPAQEQRLGLVHGPTTRFYPAGTPSGHAATTGALLSVLSEYFDTWYATALAISGTAYVSASLIYNDQHFASDILWGASMGWAVGSWVVRHRSTRYKDSGDGGVQRVRVLPTVVSGGIGAAFSGVW